MSQELSKYRINEAKKRLKAIFNSSNAATMAKGLNWYNDAHEFCKIVGSTTGIPVDVVAQIVAILSPSVNWTKNKQDAIKLITAYNAGENIDSFTVCTYGQNKVKAWKVLQGIETLQAKSLKTYSFYRNIMLDEWHVTVDRWHLRACFKTDIKSLTTLKYRQIVEFTTDVAKELQVTPMQLQAVVWEHVRK